jgi:Fic family protein
MNRGPTGEYVTVSTTGETVKAFVPAPLPPEPPLELTGDLGDLAQVAALALGRLDGVSAMVPDPQLFLYSYIRKEALLSSQIEGSQSTLSDLLQHEAGGSPGAPTDDVAEVSTYIKALESGLARLREGLPLSLRLICEIHAILLSGGRGHRMAPGEFRRSQNWIGGSRPGNARFVPPPPDRLMDCLGPWEKFLHGDPVRVNPLVKAALAHVQFETIHPFLDGNGRLGRLLITFIFCAENVLAQPLLYLSLYFKENRDRYYDLLQRVRVEGCWEEWLKFFFTGVRETAESAVSTTRRLLALFESDRARAGAAKGAATVIRLHDHLRTHPHISAAGITKSLEITVPTAQAAINELVKAGILRELTGGTYNRRYVYAAYLNILSEGTEPLP